ncbi:hypothetical protein PROFUN_07494 [Planoprotostelium fungivorum]|uniref:Enoyl reductase (ER) domain-containing protein n=1 Tax=Planoprotostelium fungivorum TaxID=1890364 RepID=A0A2P6NLJ4_9EUKA|nr:hypothetical protein PROFUN_07494 [Planoprotostelium fungivorum]
MQVFKGQGEKAVEARGEKRQVGPNDVLVKVVACGLCFTDIHTLAKGCVLGHEPVGTVEEIGSDVKTVKKGDVVGWGFVHETCEVCQMQVCPNRKAYGTHDTDQGGFGEFYVANEKSLSKVPSSLSACEAAPLFCAGATVFSAILQNGVKPTDRVGVIGVGGLGHLAVQYLNKWGCHVTTLSTSDSKKKEALQLGSHQHVITKVPEGQSIQVGEKLNHIFSTVDGALPWDQYLSILKPGGKLVIMGAGSKEFKFNPLLMIKDQLSIVGSFVASKRIQDQALEFAARHGIKPWIEVLPLNEDNLNNAIERLKKGDVHYRFVLSRE